MYSCEKENSNVIDPILNIPRLDSVSYSPNSFDTSHIVINLRAYVTSIDPVAYVTANIFNPFGLQDSTVQLTFNGSFYEGIYNRILPCWLIGNYRIEFTASTTSGLSSNTITENFGVTNTNSAKPLISIIYFPDSLRRPSGNPGDTLTLAFLKVQTSDPNGPCDMLSAFFNSVRPDGTSSTNNPFSMFDDGDVFPFHCDTVANDGKYSLLIGIDSGAQLGNYTFKFNSKDRSNVLSDTLIKFIHVYP
ncbi:MAG: hypothetical protein K8I03_07515 [Ignavibacteria bacterium]|nr:hypothetical protein [Ignavibacteria bacterium]